LKIWVSLAANLHLQQRRAALQGNCPVTFCTYEQQAKNTIIRCRRSSEERPESKPPPVAKAAFQRLMS
jgi:hypothetical protein